MTKAAEQCRVWVEAEFPGTPIGRFACRNTANGGISQHSAYKGYDSNALDIFGPDKSTSHADQVWIDAIVNAIVTDGEDKWSIRKIIWKDDGRHENHAHIDFYPMITMKKWCGDSRVPTWKYERGHSPSTITTRDPMPQNGLYDGSGSEPIDPPDVPTPPSDEEDDMKEYITAQQKNLNTAGFTDYDGRKLTIDGVYGRRTASAEAKRDLAASKSGGSNDSHKHTFNGVTGVPV